MSVDITRKLRDEGIQGNSLSVPGSAWFCAFLMMFVYAMNFLDRQLVATLAKPIEEALHLSDAEFGIVTGLAFVVLFAVVAVPTGWLVDRVRSRVKLLSLIYTVWSVATVLTGMAQNFVHLVFARLLCGIGEAGGTPTCVPIVADSFPPNRRGTALGIYNLGVPIGQGLGISIGAGIAAAAGWRSAFYVLGAVGIVTALLLPFILREPKRGAYDDHARDDHAKASPAEVVPAPHFFETMKLVCFKDRPMALALAASCVGCVVFYGFAAFMVLYLMRNKGMSLAEVATWVGTGTAVCLAISQFSSGYLADHFSRQRNYGVAYGLLPVAGGVVALLAIAGALMSPTWQLATACSVVAMAANLFWMPALEAFIQNRVQHNQRGVALSVYVMIDNLVGNAVGPTLVGAVSTLLVVTYPTHHLPAAFAFVLLPLALLVIVLFLLLWRAFEGTRGAPSIQLGPQP